MNKPKPTFKRWSFIKCIDRNKIWADDDNYSSDLELNKVYFVDDYTINYGDLRNGPLCVRVSGLKYWHKASNFVKSNIIRWMLSILNKKYITKRKHLKARKKYR